jgi:hypothetical protein
VVRSRNVYTSSSVLPPSIISMKESVFWRSSVTGMNKSYLSLHVKRLLFCLVYNKFGFHVQIFIKVPNIEFHINPFRASAQT